MLDLLIEYQGVEFPVIATILDKLTSATPFNLNDLEQIAHRVNDKLVAAAEGDFDMLLKLNRYRNLFPAPPARSASIYTHQQFTMPAERFYPKIPGDQASEYEVLQYFSGKVIQTVVLGLRARGERLMLARNIIADMEEQGMM